MKINNEKGLSPKAILALAFISLIIGHCLLQQYTASVFVGLVAFVMIVAMFCYVLIYRGGFFGFTMLVYICSHFAYGNNHGGVWNFVALAAAFVGLLFSVFSKQDFRISGVMFLMIGLFVMSNITGLIINNPVDLVSRIKGGMAFFGYMAIFVLASNINMSEVRIKSFLYISFILMVYQFLVAIGQDYSLWHSVSPLLGGNYSEMKVTDSDRPVGTIQDFELYAEYALCMFCIAIPFIASKLTREKLGIGVSMPIAMVIVSICVFILTSVRASAIICVFIFILYSILFMFKATASSNQIGRQAFLIMIILLVLPFVASYIDFNVFLADLLNIDTKGVSFESVVSGESINRGALVQYALKRIHDQSWVFGYGSGIIESNRWAWWGYDTMKLIAPALDYHNLYLCLPMIYGWIGSLSFLGMLFVTFFSLVYWTFTLRKSVHILLVLSLGMAVMWLGFMMHEYKINILRSANYQMIFWIWLGLSNSVVKSIKFECGASYNSDESTMYKNTIYKNLLS